MRLRPFYPVLLVTGLFAVFLNAGCGVSPRTLRVTVMSLSESLDPATTLDLDVLRISVHIYESLMRLGENGDPEPNLAEWCEYDSSRTSLTIRLRSGVLFHNGSSLKARDVVESLSRIAFSGNQNMSVSPGLLGNPLTVEALDDSTIVIHLPQPHAPLTRTLASPGLTPIFYRGGEVSAGITQPVGTGPYMLHRHSTETGEVVLTRFPDYWGPPPIADKLEFTVYRSSEAALEAIEKGKEDLTFTLSVGTLTRVSYSEKLALVRGPMVIYLVVGMNNSNPPFNDLEARRALAGGLDIQRIVEELWEGAAEPTNSFVGLYLEPELASPRAPGFDQDSAAEFFRSHLSEDERKIRLLHAPTATPEKRNKLYGLLQLMLNRVGLELELAYESDWAEYEKRLRTGDWEIVLDGMSTDNGDLYTFLFTLYGEESPGGGSGLFALNAEGLAESLERARTAINEESQRAAYEAAIMEIAEQVPCVPLANLSVFLARSIEVEPFTPGRYTDWTLANVRKRGWK